MGLYYLIRHGETDANKSGILQGFMDTPLSQTGRKQAQLVAQALAGKDLDAIYASDLSRAVETAEAIKGQRSCPLVKDPGLREINCGILQGRTFPEVGKLWPEVYAALVENPLDAPRPGGESYRQFYERTVSAFDRIVAANPDSSIAIVTHGGVIRNILAHAEGTIVDPRQPAVANCSISIVSSEHGKDLRVVEANVVDHLLVLGYDPRDKSSVYHW